MVLLTAFIFAVIFVCCGCGGSALNKTNEALLKIQKEEAEKSPIGFSINEISYDETRDKLKVVLGSSTDFDTVFETINKYVKDQEIGSMLFLTDPSNTSQTYLEKYEKNIAGLQFKKAKCIGLDSGLVSAGNHEWTNLIPKTDSIQMMGSSDVTKYKGDALDKIAGIKHLVMNQEPSQYINGMKNLKGVETVTLGDYAIYKTTTKEQLLDNDGSDASSVQLPDGVTDNLENNGSNTTNNGSSTTNNGSSSTNTGGNSTNMDDLINNNNNSGNSGSTSNNSGSGSTDNSATNSTDSSSGDKDSKDKEDEDVPPVGLSFTTYQVDNMTALNDLSGVKKVLIYPDGVYKNDSASNLFLYTLQLMKPDVMVNPPNETYSEDNLKKASEMSITGVSDSTKEQILEELMEDKAESIYKKCKKFKKKSGKAVLNGAAFVYKASSPGTSTWSDSKRFYSDGQMVLSELKDYKVKTPKNMNDYKTFVYIYPTYELKGHYTVGTPGYAKTLHVQVFDLENKVAYEPESVDSEEPPQTMRYYIGSIPDKYAGSTDDKEAYKYLKKLKQK